MSRSPRSVADNLHTSWRTRNTDDRSDVVGRERSAAATADHLKTPLFRKKKKLYFSERIYRRVNRTRETRAEPQSCSTCVSVSGLFFFFLPPIFAVADVRVPAIGVADGRLRLRYRDTACGTWLRAYHTTDPRLYALPKGCVFASEWRRSSLGCPATRVRTTFAHRKWPNTFARVH